MPNPPLPKFLQGQVTAPACQTFLPSRALLHPPRMGGAQGSPSSCTPEEPPRPDSPVGSPPDPGLLPVGVSPAAQPAPGVEAAPVAAAVRAADAGHVGPLGQHLQGREGLLELGFGPTRGRQGWECGEQPPRALPALTLMTRPLKTLSSSSTAAFTELCSSNSM